MEKSFEQSMKRLEEISEILTNGNISLDDSLALYSEGVKLISQCSQKLNAVSCQIKEIENSFKGE